jgi:cobalt-zinc-cadmium efflux system membrane fusion protein
MPITRWLAAVRQNGPELFSFASYPLIIALLAGILWWGHRTHWGAGSGHAGKHAIPITPAVHTSRVDAAPQPGIHKAGVEVTAVRRQAIECFVAANGVVAYNQNLRAQLSSRVSGHVWRVEKHVGEMVQCGEVLALIDAAEVGRTKGDLLKAIVQSELKAATYERLSAIQGAISGRQVREAEVAAREAKIEAQICVQALVNMGLPLRLEDLTDLNDDERAKYVQFLGLPDDLRSALSDTTTSNLIPLVAPFDGVVIGRDLAVGEVVSPDRPQFEIADIRKVWVLLEVRKEDLNSIRLGQRVLFSPDGVAGEMSGTIDWISAEVDEKTRTLQVRAELENPIVDAGQGELHATHWLRANMFGTGRICVRSEAQALIVPRSAVQVDDGKHFLFVDEGGTFTAREVKVGASVGQWVEVTHGVQESESVATLGSHVLKAQMQLASAAQ